MSIYHLNREGIFCSFLRPFVETLKDLYVNGIEWFDREKNTHRRSTVIAPVSTLDAPARSAVQNIMQFNGEFGCTLCEHPGETHRTGLGHCRVYPAISDRSIPRTKERMLSQGLQAVREELKHSRGVKSPSLTALIPAFDPATSFVPDYMHAVLSGVFLMLLSLWFDTKNKTEPFYVKKKHQRDEIDIELENIFPPDYVTRQPRRLKYINF